MKIEVIRYPHHAYRGCWGLENNYVEIERELSNAGISQNFMGFKVTNSVYAQTTFVIMKLLKFVSIVAASSPIQIWNPKFPASGEALSFLEKKKCKSFFSSFTYSNPFPP